METPERNVFFFNTLTRRKEKFVPLEKGKVKIYTCGPTVYDYAHIGNFRTFIFQDLLRRWLEYRGFRVIQVMNITDVDDKTIRGARRRGVSLQKYTEYYMKAFFEDIAALNMEKAEYYPRATQHIPEMVSLIRRLMEEGYAYRGEDGSIYYDISKFKDYGKLSKLKIEELKPGARVKVDEYGKEEARDFALWKAWDEEDGDVYWETEIGKGRPGWHIECSTMAMKYLGETIDIHSGGIDLIFPHHENEIAQSEAATGKPFARYWLHSEHLLVEGRRMAKSLGNFYTLRDLMAKGYDPLAIRFLLMSTHYRQQLNFTFDGLEAAKNAVERLRTFTRRLLEADGKGCGEKIGTLMAEVQRRFEEAMDDDLNISVALAALFDFVREVNRLMDENTLSREEAERVYALMMHFDKVLGVIGEVKAEEKLPKEAEELIRKREEARKAKDWATADKIRAQLRAMGIIIEDTPQGVKWRIEKKAG
ncbi:MAG: cysteine--tRNA ligase [Nitrososphaerota archaeon]|nr:cysteine--tRNA ligase [Candidatus Bathyarchaeota archaeon]MDW8022627.1 cysteine--tRNA ligase [Nitrososphaerota archaeon]